MARTKHTVVHPANRDLVILDDILIAGNLTVTGNLVYSGNIGGSGDGYTGSAGTVGFTGSAGIGTIGPIGYTGSAAESGGLSNLTVEANNGLELTANVMATVYNTLIADGVNSVVVGGAVSLPASTWKTKNIVEVLDTILFPDLGPTYTVPTIVISGNVSGVYELGRNVTQSLTVTAVTNDANVYSNLSVLRGSTVLAYANPPTGVITGNITAQFGYADPNNPVETFTLTYSDPITIVASTTWSANSSYTAGLPKLNNKGVPDGNTALVRSQFAPQAMSNSFTTAVNVTATGIYPYFYGKSSNANITYADIVAAISGGTASKVLVAASTNVSITFGDVIPGNIIWFAHHTTYTEKTRWYRGGLDNGPIGPGEFILSPSSQSVNSPDGYWAAQPYKIYKSFNLDTASNTTVTTFQIY